MDGSSEAKSPVTKLENLSKEDLIKFIKKQIVINQKSKAKCEELTKELEAVKNDRGKNESQLITEEQYECMKLKQETMQAAYQSTVDEMTVLSRRNKELDRELEKVRTENEGNKSKIEQLLKENNVLMEKIEWHINESTQQQQQIVAKQMLTIMTQTDPSQTTSSSSQTDATPQSTTSSSSQTVEETSTQISTTTSETQTISSTTTASSTQTTMTSTSVSSTETTPPIITTTTTSTTQTTPTIHELEQKLLDWERMMKMLERERDDVNEHLEELYDNMKVSSKLVEKLIKTIESAIPNRDIITEMSSVNLEMYSPRLTRKKLFKSDPDSELESSLVSIISKESDGCDVSVDDNHGDGGDQKEGTTCYHDVFRQRLGYLGSILDELVFERDEVKEKILHLMEISSAVMNNDSNVCRDNLDVDGCNKSFGSESFNNNLFEMLDRLENHLKNTRIDLKPREFELELNEKNVKIAKLERLIEQRKELNVDPRGEMKTSSTTVDDSTTSNNGCNNNTILMTTTSTANNINNNLCVENYHPVAGLGNYRPELIVLGDNSNFNQHDSDQVEWFKDRDGDINTFKEEIVKLKNDIQERDDLNGKLRGEFEKLKAEIDTLMIFKNESEESASKIVRLNVEINELKIILNDKESDIQELTTKLKDKSVECESNFNKISDLSAELEDLKKQLENSCKNDVEIVQLSDSLVMKSKELDLRMKEVQTLKEKLAHYEESLKNLNEERETLLKALSENETTLTNFQSEIIHLNQSHSSEIESKLEEISQLSHLLSERSEEIKNLNDLISERTSSMEQLKLRLDNETSNAELLMEDIKKKDAEILEMKEKLLNHNDSIKERSTAPNDELVKLDPSANEFIQTNLNVSTETSGDEKSLSCKSEPEVENLSSELNELVEKLRSQLKDKEDREAKLKQLALKAKKEAAESKAKLETLNVELTQFKSESANQKSSDKNVSILYQNLQNEYEKLASTFDLEQSTNKQLQKCVDQLTLELGQVKVKVAEKEEELSNLGDEMKEFKRNKMGLEATLANLEKEIQAEKIQKELISQDKLALETKLTWLEARLKQQQDDHVIEVRRLNEEVKVKVMELENARRDVQQNQMISLEIADYERAVRKLNSDLEEKTAKVKSLMDELTNVQQQKEGAQKLLETAEKQNKQSEEHCSKLKQLVVKVKKELAETKKQEGELSTSEAQLKVQNEMLNQLAEEQKLKMSELLSENHQLTEKMTSLGDSYQRSNVLLETKIANLRREIESKQSSLEKVQADYEGYKVRVHSVLKQQKTKNNDDVMMKEDKKEREELSLANEKLKAKITELRQQLSLTTAELEQLREEQDRQQLKQSQLISSFEATEMAWKEKFELLRRTQTDEREKQMETIQQLTRQNESMAQTFKDQHSNVVESLHQQLEKAQVEVDRCRTRLQSLEPQQLSTTNGIHGKSNAQLLLAEERQDGEGSENVDEHDLQKLGHSSSTTTLTSLDDKSTSSSSTHASSVTLTMSSSQLQQLQLQRQQSLASSSSSSRQNSVVPLDVLLGNYKAPTSESNDDAASDASKDEERTLSQMLVVAQRQGEHLRQLLNESEANVLRLTEQVSILKSEIRRLERNQERENSISNMEYLKNVIYKFITLKSGDERNQLVPVMNAMLKFSPDEKQIITRIANGVELGISEGGSTWSAYLPKWPGIV